MRVLYDRFRELLHEAARFGAVGLVGLVVVDSGANLLQYGAGMDRFSATAVATIVATALSFAASRYWTFRHRQRSGAGRETALFFAVNGIGVAITEGCVELAAASGRTGKFWYNIALLGGIGLATVFRYWSYKRWIWPSVAAAPGRVSRRAPRRPARGQLARLPVRELAKFGVVGALTFLAARGVAFVLHARMGAGPLASAAVGFAAVGAISYAGNRWWTFRHRQRTGMRRESVRYAAFYSAGLAVQLCWAALTVYVLGRHGEFFIEAVLIAGTAVGAAFRFWSYRESGIGRRGRS